MLKKIKNFVAVALAATILSSSFAVGSFAQTTTDEAPQTQSEIPVVTEVSEVTDFETGSDAIQGNPLEDVGTRKGTFTTSTEQNFTEGGSQSLAITGIADGTYEVFKSYSEFQVGKKLSVWLYDDGDAKRTTVMRTVSNVEASDGWTIYFGIKDNSYKAYSQSKATGSPAYTSFNASTSTRSEGWHEFTMDMTNPGYTIFLVDDVEIGRLTLGSEEEYGAFKEVAFLNFWTKPSTLTSYVDDITISEPAPVVTEITEDDTADTLDWTYADGRTNPADYEVSFDGGVNFSDVTAKPLYVGNNDYEAGQIVLRAKSNTESYTFPVIATDSAYTATINQNLPMEREEDLLYFPDIGGSYGAPTVMISDEKSRSGLASMKIVPASSNKFQIGTNYGTDALVTDKVVTIWYYDQMVTSTSYFKGVFGVEHVAEDGSKLSSSVIGVDTYKTKTNYTIRRNWGSTVDTGVQRTEGWHSFQWDFTTEGKCIAYVDGVKIDEYDSLGFNLASAMDMWAMANWTHYFDDFSITDTREELKVVPNAPTNPTTDDANNTFGWDYVTGYESPELYEISIDNGETFTTCTANPQTVEETLLPEGTVMVRVKETDTELAGSVLRNTERFTDPASIVKEKLSLLVDFINCANPNDYTDESWAIMNTALTNANTAMDSDTGLQEAFDAVEAARDTLVFDLAPQVKYEFNDGVVPVEPLYGTAIWDDDKNISYITEKSYKILTEDLNGNQFAQLKYTFPKALEDKQIIFYYFDNLKAGGGFDIAFGNSETGYGNVISSNNEDGSLNRRYQFYDLVEDEKTNRRDLGIRRRNDLHKIEINLTNGNGMQVYMDSILIFANPNVTSLDYLDFTVTRAGSTQSDISVDELYINEKNAVTDIILPDEVVDIGYYDTYEINYSNNEHVTPYDFTTTDKFTYSVSDPSVVKITKGGSIQPMAMSGTTTATVTSSNGVSKTITVNVIDYKVTGVKLSDALITQEPNFITELTMEPGTIDIVNAIIEPAQSTNLNKTWTTSNSTVATVEDGEITAYNEGEAVITVTTEDGGHQSSIKVIVKENSHEYGKELFVATTGSDLTGDGSIDNPYASVERARDELRAYSQLIENGAVVYLREGTYIVGNTIALEMQDQGSAESPIKYAAYNGEDVSLTGAVSLAPSDFTLVTDADVLTNLHDDAEGKVYQTDLSEYITGEVLKQLAVGYGGATYGDGMSYQAEWLVRDGFNVMTPYYAVSFEGSSMTLARWPNPDDNMGAYSAGFTKITSVPYAGQSIRDWNDDQIGMPTFIPEEERDIYDSFKFASSQLTERMKSWEGVPMDGSDITDLDIWYEGYTGVDYATQTSPIRSIESNGVLTSEIACHYWAKVASYTRFYVYNLIQELDIPGEWYIDQNTKMLYIYPPTGTDMTSNEEIVSLSILGEPMFELTDTQYINIDDLTLTDMLGAAYMVHGGNHNTLSNSTITNTSSRIGGVYDSENQVGMYNGIEYCTVQDVNGGFDIKAAKNYETLEPGYNFVHGCLFDNYQTLNNGFNSAVVLHGVGNYVSSTEIRNSPNNAIMWQGNDNVIEFNNIHHVDLETTDTSAIYTGRNTLNRGTVIKNNWIHHLGKTASAASHNAAIYIDDVAGGITIYDNVIEGVYWGVFINGGQHNYVYNNLFKDSTYGVVANDWSYCWLSRWYQHGYGLIKEGTWLTPTTAEWWLPDSPYAKYPNLQTIYEGDEMNDSKYNKVIGNEMDNVYSLYNYMLREVQPDAKNVIIDWFFTKDNVTI